MKLGFAVEEIRRIIMYREETEAFVAVHFRLAPSARKFDSPVNRKLIVDRMQSFGVFPSDTAVLRAIQELVAEEKIERTDGGNADTDAASLRAAEQARLDRIAAEPLTERHFDLFVRMTPDELEKKYYGDVEFRTRYTNAVRDWGFRVPPKPKGAIA
jgi:hypothetical protein